MEAAVISRGKHWPDHDHTQAAEEQAAALEKQVPS